MTRIALMAGAKTATQFMRAAAADPIEVWTKIQDELVERWEHRRGRSGGTSAITDCPYKAERDWERRLHNMLGVPWPCPATSEFWALWDEILAQLSAKGLKVGRGAFGGWGDGEPGLVRAAWCLARHLRPTNIVETGVGRGFTTRILLEAIEQNGTGRLWSIDLPPQLKPELRTQIGAAVDSHNRDHWTYIEGSSRRRLPELLSHLGTIDLFVHDSRHSERNLLFELTRAWAALKSGGAAIADDIDLNLGFHSFTTMSSGHRHVIGYAEPLQTDPTRFDGCGLFGVVRKE